jgi:hypothetical protein
MRELDESVERIELGIRSLISTTLQDDPSRLPPHVLQKVNERVPASAKKNPALDVDRYTTMSGKLEFCEFRELQDTISSKALWLEYPRFRGHVVVRCSRGLLLFLCLIHVVGFGRLSLLVLLVLVG